MIPAHHRGYMVLRHKRHPVVCTVEVKWLMSMPKWRQEKFLRNWEVVLVCG